MATCAVSTILHAAAVSNKRPMVLTVVTNNGEGDSTLVSEEKMKKKQKMGWHLKAFCCS
jgi:hypothetical protein